MPALHMRVAIFEWNSCFNQSRIYQFYPTFISLMNRGFSHQFLVIFSFLALYIIWGTTYMAIVIGLESFPPFLMAALRFIIAGCILIGISLFRGDGLPNRKALLKNIALGFVVMALGQGFLIWSEKYITSGYASVLIATLPIWFVVMDKINWKYYFGNRFILIGVGLGFVGIMVLFYDQLTTDLPAETIRMQVIASSAVIFGGICWVVGTLYNRSKPAQGTMFQNLGWQLLAGSAFCLLISTSTGELIDFHMENASWQSWSAVLYLAIASNVVAFLAYTWLLNIFPSAIVGTYAYINPIVAVLLGWLLLDEVITIQQFVGMMIILVSALIININRYRTKTIK